MIIDSKTEFQDFKAWAKKYTIKGGKHRHNRWFTFHPIFGNRNEVTFQFAFGKNCIYKIAGVDKYDINKLAGMTDTWHHHKSSARIGWRCIDGTHIELHTYTNDHWSRDIEEDKLLMSIKPEEVCSCTIEDLGHGWRFTVCNFTTQKLIGEIIRKDGDDLPIGYRLHPYFGGNMKAMHDMDIWLVYMK